MQTSLAKAALCPFCQTYVFHQDAKNLHVSRTLQKRDVYIRGFQIQTPVVAYRPSCLVYSIRTFLGKSLPQITQHTEKVGPGRTDSSTGAVWGIRISMLCFVHIVWCILANGRNARQTVIIWGHPCLSLSSRARPSDDTDAKCFATEKDDTQVAFVAPVCLSLCQIDNESLPTPTK